MEPTNLDASFRFSAEDTFLPLEVKPITTSFNPKEVANGIDFALKAIENAQLSGNQVVSLRNLILKRIENLENVQMIVSLLGDLEDYLKDPLGRKKNQREDVKRKAALLKAKKMENDGKLG